MHYEIKAEIIEIELTASQFNCLEGRQVETIQPRKSMLSSREHGLALKFDRNASLQSLCISETRSPSNDSMSNDFDCDVTITNQRTRAPPSFLPVTSCFEEDDDFESSGYHTLLEDVSSLELYDDYMKNDVYMTPVGGGKESNRNDVRSRYDDERWLRECEEIISPYSPNKAYFRLVHVLENQ